jgi:hypothetical protein
LRDIIYVHREKCRVQTALTEQWQHLRKGTDDEVFTIR